MKTYTCNKIAKALGVEKTLKLINLLCDLEWELDRMTEGGQETYEELMKLLEIE